MKLYVWEGVLCDYTDGIMFALAESPEQARALCLERLGPGWGPNKIVFGAAELEKEPDVYETEPVAFAIHGGG